MKKIFFTICFAVISILAFGQANFGTLEEIKARHPNVTFKISHAENGIKYAFAKMEYETVSYYFDKETGLSYKCVLFPDNQGILNGLVEDYNKNYVIISETSWKVYQVNGIIVKINLHYDEQNKVSYFSYYF